MPQFSIGRVTELDHGYILAPERYDPRKLGDGRTEATARHRLFDIVELRREILTKSAAEPGKRYMVLDTGNAKDGVLTITNAISGLRDCIGSAKKVIYPGDVIISRLRPYLRQVAYVDDGLGENAQLLSSTEFYVLRPTNGASIAFLVPFLLSRRTQERLAAAQEGGHHPRFSDRVLTNLAVPDSIIDRRAELSTTLESSLKAVRDFENGLAAMTRDVDAALAAIS